jgi:DNA-binding PucR family transcriptional regulator
MGDELIETLTMYLASGQNSREAARRLHLSPRTVSYRLERIESLLGHDLDTEASLRLGAALLALRVARDAGRETAVSERR